MMETTSIIFGPFLIKENFDGATKNRTISSKQNHITHMVSMTKNIQKYVVSPPPLCTSCPCVIFNVDNIGGGGFISLRIDGSVSIINNAIDNVIMTMDITATARATLDDSGHSNTSQILR
jgi:hypothetical protein